MISNVRVNVLTHKVFHETIEHMASRCVTFNHHCDRTDSTRDRDVKGFVFLLYMKRDPMAYGGKRRIHIWH